MMSAAHAYANLTERQKQLDACTETWSAAHCRFTEVLQQRENVYRLALAAEKAGDSAALATHYENDRSLDAEYDIAARALCEAHRNHKIALQSFQGEAPTRDTSPPDPKLALWKRSFIAANNNGEVMEWKAEYETGIQEIDDHHKTILGFITDFERAAVAKHHWNAVQPLLRKARDFTQFHFAVEESLMQILAYPGFAAHRSEHRHVMMQMESLENGVLRQDLKDELLPVLRTWLFDHIIESDKHFSAYALGRIGGLAGTPEAGTT